MQRSSFPRYITLSIAVIGVLLVSRLPFAQEAILRATSIPVIGEMIAGLTYTSVITTPVSIALISALSETTHPFLIAAVGGIGSVFGDFLLMTAVSQFGKMITIKKEKPKICERGILCTLAKPLGALCLALPIPDEVAMALLGIKRISVLQFVAIVYPMKTFGIFLVAVSASRLTLG